MFSLSELWPRYSASYGDVTSENVIRFMVMDEANPASIINRLKAVRENARTVRGEAH